MSSLGSNAYPSSTGGAESAVWFDALRAFLNDRGITGLPEGSRKAASEKLMNVLSTSVPRTELALMALITCKEKVIAISGAFGELVKLVFNDIMSPPPSALF